MSEHKYTQFIKSIQNKKILCIGDIILDNFSDNQIIKISDEDPVFVIKEKESFYKLGGVGNVALNLSHTGAKVKLITLGSNDDNFKIIRNILKEKNIKSKIFYKNNRITTLKKRYYINQHHLLRHDNENTQNTSKLFSDKIILYLNEYFKNNTCDVILVSDYGKGIITQYFFKKLYYLTKIYNINIFTDPKSKNLEIYNGSFVLKTNKNEINNYLLNYKKNIDQIDRNLQQRKIILKILSRLKIENLIITRSENSSIIIQNGKKKNLLFINVHSSEIVNTTGAGDTFFSYFAINYIINSNLRDATEFAHLFSKFAINRFGTYAPSFSQIFLKILKIKNISFSKDKLILKKIISDLKNKKIKIGFANGCFDILHAGHINLLRKAKSKCDFLILGLNNDISVKKNKGKKRPYNDIETRSLIMSSLSFVDLICIFDEITPLNLIKYIKPDLLFKGSDYVAKDVIGYKFLQQHKGKVIIIQNYKNYSSTKTIKKIN